MAPVSSSENETAVFESGFIASFMASFMAAFQAARYHDQFHIYFVEMSEVHHIRVVHGLLLGTLPFTGWRLFRILT